jgi:hypothetical protein
VAGDEPPVPPQDGGWGDEPVHLQRSGQELDQGGEHGTVGPVQTRCGDLPSKDRVLVTENQDLHIFGRGGTGESQPAIRQNTR